VPEGGLQPEAAAELPVFGVDERHDPLMNVVEVLSTREQAFALWVLAFLGFALALKGMRRSLGFLVKAMFARKLVLYFGLFAAWAVGAVTLLAWIGFWDKSFLKDTVFWYAGVGLPLAYRASKVKSRSFMKRELLDALKLTVLVEYLINLYTFSLPVELILLPFLVLIYGMQAFSERKQEYAAVHKLMTRTIALVGFGLFGFVVFKTVQSYQQVFVARMALELVLPVLLLLLFLPFNYFSALYIAYETLFTRIRFLFHDEQRRNDLKKQIRRVAGLDMDKLMAISENLTKRDWLETKDVHRYVLSLLQVKM
jgi:hypothetical protein